MKPNFLHAVFLLLGCGGKVVFMAEGEAAGGQGGGGAGASTSAAASSAAASSGGASCVAIEADITASLQAARACDPGNPNPCELLDQLCGCPVSVNPAAQSSIADFESSTASLKNQCPKDCGMLLCPASGKPVCLLVSGTWSCAFEGPSG